MLSVISDEERRSGRIMPPDYLHPDPEDKSTAICFILEDRTKPNCHTVQLQRRSGHRALLGAIEYNERLQCWYITHIAREPLSKAQGLPYLSFTYSSQYLYEEWRSQRKQQLRALSEV